jgi:hypothetical protein
MTYGAFNPTKGFKIILLRLFSIVIMTGRSPPTVYAFLNPKFPSATWDFFCLEFTEPLAECRSGRAQKLQPTHK